MGDQQLPFQPAPLLGLYEREFRVFHGENPHVYDALRTICLELREKGITRFGIRTVWERLRWLSKFSTKHRANDYKLNDHHTRFYARLLMDQEPELKGFFETRDHNDERKK